MKKSLKIVSKATTILLSILLILMIYLVVSSKINGGEPSVMGFQLKTVLSGSMEPTFKTGSIIAIKPVKDPSLLKKGDVITFWKSQDALATHRIIKVWENEGQMLFQTKGDNNDNPDSEAVVGQNIVGKYTGFTIPYAGYIADLGNSKEGSALLLVIPGILLIFYSALTIFRAIREVDKVTKSQNEVEKTA
ncbi:signal peptidase I SipW [Bacillus sp. EB01]|uniref:signal peptidase I SipW n=1 Tax=Bacillus sp. EB01 TaxID=1347086 RepID=UPI0005C700DC|nr:signal peptidase I [Bacillus sp. EB01]